MLTRYDIIAPPGAFMEKVVQYLMILLVFFMLVIPILTQPTESEAILPFIIGGAFVVGGIVLHEVVTACSFCGKWGANADHHDHCNGGHSYYRCDESAAKIHAKCPTGS